MESIITLRRPDDWHVHLRDGDVLSAVLPDTARHFGRAIIMPNLVPPVAHPRDARAYRGRILDALPRATGFHPLMTLYLTEETEPSDVAVAYDRGEIAAVKLYPAGATTNSASGVRDVEKVMPVLEAMAEHDVPLLVHGEVTTPEVDIFDREARFIEDILDPLRRRLPQLRVVMEHVTTAEGVTYVQEASGKIGATITVHHLIIDRNDLLVGGIRPHLYCLPIAKRAHHREALVQASISGSSRFFLGTDSAPHLMQDKESACGCAGIYTAPVALSCLAHVFEAHNALDRLEAFASLNGPAFYGLPPNDARITLRKGAPLSKEDRRRTAQGDIVIFDPGFDLEWHVEGL